MTNDKASNNAASKTSYDRGDSAAAPIDANTLICGKSKGDSSQHANKSDSTFTKGQTVFYKTAQGIAVEAHILEVHVDDLLVPYYTIRLLSDGREKQTEGARLSTLSELCKSTESNQVDKNVQSPTTPLRPLRSILRPSSYGQNRRVTPVTPLRKGDEGLLSSKIFLQSIDKKLSERKAREKRAAQVVTPDSDHQRGRRRLNMTPRQLVYSGTRKRKRSDDDDDDVESTRVRKRRKLVKEDESSMAGEDPLPFYFMPRSSKLSSSSDINHHPRIYPEIVPNFPLDWPVNGGGYYPISFHDKHSQTHHSRSIEYQMLLFDEVLKKLENDDKEERMMIGTSKPSFLSSVVSSLSTFSSKYVSNSWEYIRSKLSFGSTSVKPPVESIPSEPLVRVASDQACTKSAAVDVPLLSHTNVARYENPITSATQTQHQAHSSPNVTMKALLPRPPDRWQNAFAIKEGHWKCKACFHQNPSEAMTCDVCTALRDDRRVSVDSQSVDAQSSDAQSTDVQTGDAPSIDVQSDSSHTEVSENGDSYTDEDTHTSSDAGTDDDTLTTKDTDPDDCQVSCSSVEPTQANPTSPKATPKVETSNASPSSKVTNNSEGRRRSSLALAVERIRADRARNTAFHAHHNARMQMPLPNDEANETNRSKRLRRERSMGHVHVTETPKASTVSEELDLVDLDLAPFLDASLDTDVETMSVTSSMSFVDRVDKSEMMELDGTQIKRGSNDCSAYGKKQRFG